MKRHVTREVKIGSLAIGGENPVAIQTMWDRPIEQPGSVLKTIDDLVGIGCDLIRFSVLDRSSLLPLQEICTASPIPVIADIHFDYLLAIAAIERGAAKIRINPGNIGAKWKVHEIIQAAKDHKTAIRIGINGGSLPRQYRNIDDHAASMMTIIKQYIDVFERKDFSQIVISLKDSDVETCYEVNKAFTEYYDYPLHLGVTEAGPLIPSITKSAYALGRLLHEGVGDTIRISITGDIRNEVIAAKELLMAVGRYHKGVHIISCPKCGRAGFNTHRFMNEIGSELQHIHEEVTIAVMGCAVNGPGEAARADIGITGLGNDIVIFKEVTIIRHVKPETAKEAFFQELRAIINEKHHN